MPAVESLADRCQTAADVAAAAALVRQRRKAVFFVAPKPESVRIEVQPVKRPEPVVVPTPSLGLFAMLMALHPLKDEMASKISMDDIVRSICGVLHVKKNDLLSNRRTNDVVVPRHIAFVLCKRLTSRSLPEIGRHFGGKDHTTVLHGIRKLAPVIADVEDAIDIAPLPYAVAILAAAYDRIKPVSHRR